MKAQEYIQQELENLHQFNAKEIAKENLADEIFRLLMSKRFRKYSADPKLIEHIKKSIQLNIQNNQPINFTFLQGAYKLWRFKEAPLPDWAALFAAMYYTKWLKTICEIYKPGVWFDYFVDDVIVTKIDNIPLENIELYQKEYQKVLNFLKQYQPNNFRMTITRFIDQYSSLEVFEKLLQQHIEKLSLTNPTFTEEQLGAVELCAKPTPEQLKDPLWKEKVRLIHDAYMTMKKELGYNFKDNKIPVFNQPRASDMFLAVGTTKTSIAKFWIGIGALKQIVNGFIEYVLSPRQVELINFQIENIQIKGLDSKNFETIRIFK